jgi:aminoglycoside phosphotransferase family enzyme
MMNNEFKERLSIIRDRFNQTFDMNPLIRPEIRRSAMWAVIKLGILERQTYRSPTTENIQEFERIQTIIEKVFARVEQLNRKRQKEPAD